MLEQAHSDP